MTNTATHTAEFCRKQEGLERARAADSVLENVRVIAARAAVAWGREARLAQDCEDKRRGRNALAGTASPSGKVVDRLLSENPDRGMAD